MTSASPVLIYLHIPKAGGTTLNQIFHSVYGERAFDTNLERVKDKPRKTPISEILQRKESFADVDIIFGNHYQFGIHRFLPKDRPFKYVTLLRNPVSRVVSHYNHVRSRGNHKLYDVVNDNNYSIEDYVSKGITKEADNGMVRQIIGSKKKIFELDESDLEQAIEHLDKHFALIGLLEHFEDTLKLFQAKFNWSDIPTFDILNKKKVKLNSKISDNEMLTVEQFNKYDVRLYNHCTNRFRKQLTTIV
jgi:hypothetical protein